MDSEADIAEGLGHLLVVDPRLDAVVRQAGPFGPRRRPAGFAGLARIVVGQQVSVASAAAIWTRFEAAFPRSRWQDVAAADEADLSGVGLSRPKVRTLRAVAAACADGLDLNGLGDLDATEAHERLTAISGIGPWSADIYLMFCLGDADIFPAGDLALRHAVSDAFDLGDTIPIDDLAAMARQWAPWRSVAACLFWAYYRVRRSREGLPA